MDTVYKLTTQDNKTRKGCDNECTWGPGITHQGTGQGMLCGPGFIHAYLSPELAVLLNPIHAGISEPKLWVCETQIVKNDRNLKVGGVRLTTLKEIPLPKISLRQKIIFAILCSRAAGFANKTWDEWADAYVADAAYAAADGAADGAADAAYAARRAAAIAADGAASAYAAYATAYAAARAAYAAADGAADGAAYAAYAAADGAADAVNSAARAAYAADAASDTYAAYAAAYAAARAAYAADAADAHAARRAADAHAARRAADAAKSAAYAADAADAHINFVDIAKQALTYR